MTNFERIKQMTQVEVAEFLSNVNLFDDMLSTICREHCEHLDANKHCTIPEGCMKSDVALINHWLKLDC